MLSFLYVYSDHSILECYNLFSGVELSMRSFFVISIQCNFFERVDLAFALLYVYCLLRRMGGIFLLCIEETFD